MDLDITLPIYFPNTHWVNKWLSYKSPRVETLGLSHKVKFIVILLAERKNGSRGRAAPAISSMNRTLRTLWENPNFAEPEPRKP